MLEFQVDALPEEGRPSLSPLPEKLLALIVEDEALVRTAWTRSPLISRHEGSLTILGSRTSQFVNRKLIFLS
jgi:hypothetical protein